MKARKILTVVFSLAMLLYVGCFSALAEGTENSAPPPYAVGLSGTGSQEDPYIIANLDDLKWFRDSVNTYTSDGSNQYKNKYVKLTADINLYEVDENGNQISWEPIGINSTNDHNSFLGTFDGGNHTISNLYINKDGGLLGFFAYVGGYNETIKSTVKNIIFDNINISGNTASTQGNYVGGVIANAGGFTTVSDVHVKGLVNVSGYGYVGGIVGHGYPKVDKCSVVAEEGSSIHAGYWCAGGIVGYGGEGSTSITNCSVEGLSVYGASGGAAAVAGLLNDDKGQYCTMSNVSAKNVKVTGSDFYSGYIAGNGSANVLTNVSMENVEVAENITASDIVAKIGDKGYFSIHDAVAAVGAGETIDICKNILLDKSITIQKSYNYTINGNGHSISPVKNGLKDNQGKVAYHAFYISAPGSDKRYNNKGEDIGYVKSEAVINLNDITFKNFNKESVQAVILRIEYAKQFNLNNITFDNCDVSNGAGSSYSVMRMYNTNFEADNLTMNNCKGNLMMDIGPSSYDFIGKIVIKNSQFTNNTALSTALIYDSLDLGDDSYISISSSKFIGNVIGDSSAASPSGRAVLHLQSDAYVDDCTFDGNKVYGAHYNLSCGINNFAGGTKLEYTNNTIKNSAVYQTYESLGVAGVAMMATGTLTAEGNTVEDNNKFYSRTAATEEYEEKPARSVAAFSEKYGTATIVSGTYYGDLVTYAGDKSIKVSGGTFSTDVSEYCADGYAPVINPDGTYTVETAAPAEPEILKKSLYVTYSELGKFDFGNGEVNSIKLSLFAGVDSLNYSEVGFDVTVGDEIQNFPVNVVYDSVKTIIDGEETTVEASEFGEGVNYIFGQTINFPATSAFADVTVKWTPYALKNNEKISGNTFTLEDVFPGELEVEE